MLWLLKYTNSILCGLITVCRISIFFLQSAALPSRVQCMPGILSRNCKKRSKTFMLSTLISLYKLLGTGDFVKVLLILLKGLFG